MVNYAVVNQENIIENIIVATAAFAEQTGALPVEGQGIGDLYQQPAAPLRGQYEALTVQRIRREYSPDEEHKLHREYLASPADEAVQREFADYNAYVEQCKAEAYLAVYGEEKA